MWDPDFVSARSVDGVQVVCECVLLEQALFCCQQLFPFVFGVSVVDVVVLLVLWLFVSSSLSFLVRVAVSFSAACVL